MLLSQGCTQKQHFPKVIAHRGGSNLAPENTLAAFKNAIELGVDMIEIDVEQTSDSVVVVLHDDKVDRTTNGSGWVDSLSYEYVKTLDAGSWFSEEYKDEKIPSLDDVLALVNGQVILLIEIKGGSETYLGIEKRTVEAIKKHNAIPWTIVQSFNEKAVERVKDLDPDIMTYYLLGRNFPEYYETYINKGNVDSQIFKYDGIAVHYSVLNANNVDSIKSTGLGVFSWTVDESADVENMIRIGVDGIITDSPDEIIDIVRNGSVAL